MADVRIRPDILYAWKGPSLLIVNTRGECGSDQGLSGFYYREARFLRMLRVEIDGERPWLCDAAAVSPDRLDFTFTHPEVVEPGGGGTGHSDDVEHLNARGLPERGLDLRLTYTVKVGRLELSLVVGNHGSRRVGFALDIFVDADFADIQEAQSGKREQQAAVRGDSRDAHIDLWYADPNLPYRAAIQVSGDGWNATAGKFHCHMELDPRATATARLDVVPSGTRMDLSEPDVRQRESRLEEWRSRFARFEAPGNRDIERTVTANVRDFASFPMLDGRCDEWLAPQAGMPSYPAFFGRDALTAGWQAGYVDRGETLDAALSRLARLQSDRFDDWRDEEPGRVPYQVRQGPLALLNLNPYAAYYADYVSPLMFVISLANLLAWTGDDTRIDHYWDTAQRIMDWARRFGDKDGDGYLEYETRSSDGTKNQGWKDSGDAIIYPDGSPVPPPIATCEIQGYWYLAQELMASLCLFRGARDDAAEHHRNAGALKERFNRDWWVEGDGCIAMALDPDKRPVAGVTSNVGHCIACGIIDAEHLPRVVGRLFAPDMFSGWGIRTLSSDHVFYNPLSYHRGTVWAVEQASIAFGLRRFGFDARALDLTRALFDLAELYPDRRIPECIGGYSRGEQPTPSAYPRANAPQLWNATAFPLLVQTLTGLLPLAPLETLIIDPILPEWLPEVILHDVRVGQAKASLRCWRGKHGDAEWEVLHKSGTLRIIRQPPVESMTATVSDRLRGGLESVAEGVFGAIRPG